ncbi:MAG: cyclic nucleotide-binding domain-containing protein, partial [Desulfitobacteriaceae bacterium]
MIEDKVYNLANLELFSELTSAELTELANDFQWQDYEEGSEIIKQNQEQNPFYVLVEGKAAVFINKEGHPWRVHSFGPGDVFGDLSLLTGKPSPTSIRCLKQCRVLALDAVSFGQMLLRWPHLNQTFVSRVFQNLNDTNLILSEAKYKEYLRSSLQLTKYKEKFYGLWGSVKTTKETERKLEELSQSAGNLLLKGERGTGRQMMAWYVHQRRFGEKFPFITVEGRRFDQQWGDLIVVQVSQKGSTTIPNNSLFDIAKGGTLYIGEIDLISPHTQLKLSQALKTLNNKCSIIGSIQSEPDASGPKIIPELLECFTHTYEITPLRERKRDIPILAQGILEKMALKNKRNVPMLNQEATQLLLSHHYSQGNVTELIQVIERAFFLAEKDIIGLEQIFFGPTSEKSGLLLNLLSWPKIENFFKKGTFILGLRLVSALIFTIIVLLLLFAPTLTLTTKIFVLVWGLWWPALVIISPFLGRLWCSVCPFSTIMDFIQKKLHLNRPVPDFFIKYDYLVVSFLFLLILWFEVFTAMRFSPAYTAAWLITVQAAAILIGILYPRHTWCHHFCPLGGFIGTASIGSMVEVRADADVCLNKCTTFECYVGKDRVAGCPMSQHLPYLDNNLNCKLCFNCVRNCPNGSVQV